MSSHFGATALRWARCFSSRTPKLYIPKWGLPVANGVFGEVSQVLCEVGSRVFEDETVLVVETDKLAFDVKASRSGVVSEVLVAVGDSVLEHQPVYTLMQPQEELPPPPPGSAAALRERRWAVQHEQERDAARAEQEQQWKQSEQQQRKQQRDERQRRRSQQQRPFDWRWTRRPWRHESGGGWSQQGGATGGREGSWRHERRAAAWGAANTEPSSQALTASELDAMPLGGLVERVLKHKHSPLACLGLPPTTAPPAVRRRYLQLALRLHPDKADHAQAREAFTAVDTSFRHLRPQRGR